MGNAFFLLGSNVASGIISGIIVIYLDDEGFTKMAYLVFALYLVTIITVAIYVFKNWNALNNKTDRALTKRDDGKINIRPIGDQVFQMIDGATLARKWSLSQVQFLAIIKNGLIDAIAPDQDLVVNKTDAEFGESVGFYSSANEIDEDTIVNFKFKPTDIKRFEMIAGRFDVKKHNIG